MLNPQEVTIELKKYLKKLFNLIENEASFTLINTKIIDKGKLDDVLCCIEASWPEDFKAYIKKQGKNRLKSYKYYNQLLDVVRNKFLFSSNVYSVKFKEALPIIRALLTSLDSDIAFIYSDQSGMF